MLIGALTLSGAHTLEVSGQTGCALLIGLQIISMTVNYHRRRAPLLTPKPFVREHYWQE